MDESSFIEKLDSVHKWPEDYVFKFIVKTDQKKEFEIKIILSRIADLSPKIQLLIKDINFFKTSKPIFYGNNGYSYIKCNIKKAKLGKVDYKKLKNITMNKYFLIYSEKLLKRLNSEASITQIEQIK